MGNSNKTANTITIGSIGKYRYFNISKLETGLYIYGGQQAFFHSLTKFEYWITTQVRVKLLSKLNKLLLEGSEVKGIVKYK